MLPEELAVDLVRFERELNEFAAVLQLDLTRFSADHISLRCHQTSTAERWKTQILRIGTLLAENLINGRPICLFILNSAIKVGPWRIDCIELPWPGKKRYPHEGWEHVELLLPGDADSLHLRALACLSDQALRTSGVKLHFSSPQGEKERIPNPTTAVTNGKVTIKFHPFDIRDIVADENRGA
ncbi:VOC family protein [Brenneria nigrifluens]|uniref:VOC family protein n=1 Tax=Brenneria nigrifluens DSM 30175 = ATCC 13028 TaxID=1121120 RepID=A0A2U1UU48_9GAMM|nr:VOC family protein [Brenneria nigrifluens]PWC25195.1 VOC family protein [Brenneria nigrifluens] [Brenneria nigrifluens DSM 30175 = ATCC 13028]QCR04951.1 VOC family protein [Brenneria nigrifluens] [Brenneria nigrifluens DSM 30175 = ATCC 13028]